MAGDNTRRVKVADGIEIAAHHLGGDGPPVMVAHATGFHGRCYAPMAKQLTPYFSVWALDQRGHGASGRPADGRYDEWSRFADDLLRVLADLEPGARWGGVGHSLGGAVVLMAEAMSTGTFSALCCYEPVVLPPDWRASAEETAAGETSAGRTASDGGSPTRTSDPVPLAALARKRRPSFESRAAAFDNYRSKPPFSTFDSEALRSYVEYGFTDCGDGTVTLACAREDEAAVFESAPSSGAWSTLSEVRPPVAVLAGASGQDLVARAADPVARRLPRGGIRRFPHLDHFGPLTAPAEVGQVAAAALGAPVERSTIAVTSPG